MKRITLYREGSLPNSLLAAACLSMAMWLACPVGAHAAGKVTPDGRQDEAAYLASLRSVQQQFNAARGIELTQAEYEEWKQSPQAKARIEARVLQSLAEIQVNLSVEGLSASFALSETATATTYPIGPILGIVDYPGIGFAQSVDDPFRGRVDPYGFLMRAAEPGERVGAPYDWTRPIPVHVVTVRGQVLPDPTDAYNAFYAAYFARWGRNFSDSGTPSLQVGYMNELYWVNAEALIGWARAHGITNPTPSTVTERYDVAWSSPRGAVGGFYYTYFIAPNPGGTADNPIHVFNTALAPGLFSKPKDLISSFTGWYWNDYAGGPPPPPAPFCGDGIKNGNETCSSCPADVGPCAPPPVPDHCNAAGAACRQPCASCPVVKPCKPVPQSLVDQAKAVMDALKPGTLKTKARAVHGALVAMRNYCPVVQSTGASVTTLRDDLGARP